MQRVLRQSRARMPSPSPGLDLSLLRVQLCHQGGSEGRASESQSTAQRGARSNECSIEFVAAATTPESYARSQRTQEHPNETLALRS